MIPHRLLSNELLVHGLKQRVTACRMRLRVNRHRLHSHEGQAPMISKPTSETSASFPAEYLDVRESLIEGGEAFEFQRRELWLRPEQEVGTT